MNLLVTICKVLFTVALGYYLGKKQVLTEQSTKAISKMVLNITAPLLMIVSVSYVEPGQKKIVSMLILSGVILYLFTPLFGYGVSKIIHAPKHIRGVIICMIIFSNNGFLGYPVVQSLYGDSAIFYDAMFHFPFNFFFYTLGLFLITRDAGETSKIEFKQFLNPGSIFSIIAAIIYFASIHMPDVIMEPCTFVGNMTSPLSLIVIGANISGYSFKQIFEDKRIYWITLFRLIIMPAIVALVLNCFMEDKTLVAVCAMTVGMPVASSVAMAGCQFEDTKDISNIGVAFSTLCFFITMPIMAVIFKIWLGV